MIQLELGRRGAGEDDLIEQALEFTEVERPVVHGAGQAEAVVDQDALAALVAGPHAAHLGDGHVALVDDHQVVGREVVEQRPRARAGRALVEVAAVVLDAGGEAHLAQHLQVVHHALLDALRFQETLLVLVESDALGQFRLDVVDGPGQLLLVGDELARRVDGDTGMLQQHLASQRFELGDAFDGVAPELDQVGRLGVGGVNLERVAADPKGAAP